MQKGTEFFNQKTKKCIIDILTEAVKEIDQLEEVDYKPEDLDQLEEVPDDENTADQSKQLKPKKAPPEKPDSAKNAEKINHLLVGCVVACTIR